MLAVPPRSGFGFSLTGREGGADVPARVPLVPHVVSQLKHCAVPPSSAIPTAWQRVPPPNLLYLGSLQPSNAALSSSGIPLLSFRAQPSSQPSRNTEEPLCLPLPVERCAEIPSVQPHGTQLRGAALWLRTGTEQLADTRMGALGLQKDRRTDGHTGIGAGHGLGVAWH